MMDEGKCIHFTGIRSKTDCCEAGVNYYDAFGPEGGVMLRMPCIRFMTVPADGRGTYVKPGVATVRKEHDRHGKVMIPCDKFLAPTAEQVEQDRIESEAHMQKTFAALKVASAWRVRPKPAHDRKGVVECPICKGNLQLSQSAYNGHVWGRCETQDCVSWME